MYTTPSCKSCRKVIDYLKGLGHEVVERSDVESLGLSTVPVTKIGTEFVVGADLRKIRGLLRRNRDAYKKSAVQVLKEIRETVLGVCAACWDRDDYKFEHCERCFYQWLLAEIDETDVIK